MNEPLTLTNDTFKISTNALYGLAAIVLALTLGVGGCEYLNDAGTAAKLRAEHGTNQVIIVVTNRIIGTTNGWTLFSDIPR